MSTRPRSFASDNASGVCPEAWEALAEANRGHTPAYGADPWTERAVALLRETFETDCRVYFTFTGTAANALALGACVRSHHAILAHELAHIEVDECGAPEFFTGGAKVVRVDGAHGKLEPAAVTEAAERRRDVHFPRARAVSLTQATEMGTVYTAEEVRALAAAARTARMAVHIDGARFANAVATLESPPRELSADAGVDVLCLGGTKNGLPAGEAVLFFNGELADEFESRIKQAGQLASKARFLAAPWVGVLENGAWLRHARNANTRAAQLESGLRRLAERWPYVTIVHPREANVVFVRLPPSTMSGLQAAGWFFYDFPAAGGARLMCSWDTTESDVNDFLDAIAALLPDSRPDEETDAYPVMRH